MVACRSMLHPLFKNLNTIQTKLHIMSAAFVRRQRFINIFALKCSVYSRATFNRANTVSVEPPISDHLD